MLTTLKINNEKAYYVFTYYYLSKALIETGSGLRLLYLNVFAGNSFLRKT